MWSFGLMEEEHNHNEREGHDDLTSSKSFEDACDAFQQQHEPQLVTGRVIGSYELGQVIGSGAFGEVRYALHRETEKAFAIKIMDRSRFRDERLRRRMAREIEVLRAASSHPHIISVHEIIDSAKLTGTWCTACGCSEFVPLGPDDQCAHCAPHDSLHHGMQDTRDVTLVVQELALGGELFGLLMHTGPLSEPLARLFFHQLIDGVSFLHARGFIHRDIKPENLVISRNFDLKIVDFGLAANLAVDAVPRSPGTSLSASSSSSSSSSSLPNAAGNKRSREGSTVSPSHPRSTIASSAPHLVLSDLVLHSAIGSQPYTAPEVSYNKELFDSRGYRGEPADLWSCAVVLYIMLTGKPPFRRPLYKSINRSLRRCRHYVNLQNGVYPKEISSEARDLLQRLLSPEPHKRLTVAGILKHPWMQGAVPSRADLVKELLPQCTRAWQETRHAQMAALLQGMYQQKLQIQQRQSALSRALAQQPRAVDTRVTASKRHTDAMHTPGSRTNEVNVVDSVCTDMLDVCDSEDEVRQHSRPVPIAPQSDRSLQILLATPVHSAIAHLPEVPAETRSRRLAERFEVTATPPHGPSMMSLPQFVDVNRSWRESQELSPRGHNRRRRSGDSEHGCNSVSGGSVGTPASALDGFSLDDMRDDEHSQTGQPEIQIRCQREEGHCWSAEISGSEAWDVRRRVRDLLMRQSSLSIENTEAGELQVSFHDASKTTLRLSVRALHAPSAPDSPRQTVLSMCNEANVWRAPAANLFCRLVCGSEMTAYRFFQATLQELRGSTDDIKSCSTGARWS
ncbi:MAG: hypothetical protein MHM6MM_000905 [Cercozoa sp. M6MM]